MPASSAEAAGGLKGEFPSGLRVMVVDDDPLCLRVVEQMLKRCSYQVLTCNNAASALELLREKRNGFDLVLSDVYMPDMDGFKLLETVGLELDLPVIMMSSNGEHGTVLRGVTHGACDFLIKPVRIEELRNIWQHVIRRQKSQSHSERDGDGDGTMDSDTNSRKRKEGGRLDSNSGGERDEEGSSAKKSRVVWSVEMHQQFVAAVNQLGIEKAAPKKILELMSVEGLTRENVASHLQKYRLYLKRVQGVAPGDGNGDAPGSGGGARPDGEQQQEPGEREQQQQQQQQQGGQQQQQAEAPRQAEASRVKAEPAAGPAAPAPPAAAPAPAPAPVPAPAAAAAVAAPPMMAPPGMMPPGMPGMPMPGPMGMPPMMMGMGPMGMQPPMGMPGMGPPMMGPMPMPPGMAPPGMPMLPGMPMPGMAPGMAPPGMPDPSQMYGMMGMAPPGMPMFPPQPAYAPAPPPAAPAPAAAPAPPPPAPPRARGGGAPGSGAAPMDTTASEFAGMFDDHFGGLPAAAPGAGAGGGEVDEFLDAFLKSP